MGRPDDQQLRALVQSLQEQIPRLDARLGPRGLELRAGTARSEVRRGSIQRYSLAERRARRAAGESYVDPSVGEVYVESPELVLFLRLGRPKPHLTPQQCAVLAAVLETDELAWLDESLDSTPSELRDGLERRVGIRLAPSSVTKLTSAIHSAGLRPRGQLSGRRIVDEVLGRFRLDSVGKQWRIPAPREHVVEWVREEVAPTRVVEGVGPVLSAQTGAILEPLDVLLEKTEARDLVKRMGGPVPTAFSGPSVVVRSVARVPLDELAPREDRLSTLLAVADGLKSSSPVVAEIAERVADGWRSRWK